MDGSAATSLLPRLVALSRSGRFAAIRQPRGLDLVDALGTAPRQHHELPELHDFALVGRELWITTNASLSRHELGDLSLIGDAVPMDTPLRIRSSLGDASPSVLAEGSITLLLRGQSGKTSSENVSTQVQGAELLAPLSGRRIAAAFGDEIHLHDLARGDVAKWKLRAPGRPRKIVELFSGRVLAIWFAGDSDDHIAVIRPGGAIVHNVKVPKLTDCAFAEVRGMAVGHADGELHAVDLRYGRKLSSAEAPMPVDAVDVDAGGKHVLLAGFRGDEERLSVLHLPYATLFAPRSQAAAEAQSKEPESKGSSRQIASPEPERPVDASEGAEASVQEEDAPSDDDEVVEIQPRPSLALGTVTRMRPPAGPAGKVEPYRGAAEHLSALVELISLRTARAIADAWDSGQLSLPSQDARPFEREVNALVGARAGGAKDIVKAFDQKVSEQAADIANRVQATLAREQRLPFLDIVREFRLSPTAAQALIVAVAPQVRGEVARLFGILANDEGRPICDRYLIEHIIAGRDTAARQRIAGELQSDSPLLTHGLLRVLPAPSDMYMFAPVTVDPVLISRLRGNPYASAEPMAASSVRHSDRELTELAMDKGVIRDAIVALGDPMPAGHHARVVLRGRPGCGRRTLFAALAATIDRPIAVIDCEKLPRQANALAERLRIELRRAALRGTIPCVSGLEILESGEPEGLERVRDVFRSHRGPIAFRSSPETRPPLDPGYFEFTIPPLSEGARAEVWAHALESRGLAISSPADLAARFRVGPGIIETVVAGVHQRIETGSIEPSDDYQEVVDAAARQHIDTRLSQVASRVTRLARWEQVALPDDLLDSIREFVGRVRQRKTVYETWGFESKMSTSRGLTALFYGPPGTGKTMVSGLIARELGLDLYRVDLARITSKWIGETEKNLAQIFDAAEDGQAVVVFDEADSLFAKRTEVKSSVDRYANLEVNYLLQRLDSFEGIAILTTNLEGSIDNAFKRRLSLRLAFPFPDEEMRVRLWSAHVPPETPTDGEFDFADLAKRFPMSGGYIRNAMLRAAFLAAHENAPLSQEHLERAITLEYREMGKLSAGGRME